MVNKLMVSALVLSAVAFVASPASAGFDEEGKLTLHVYNLKRAVEAGKNGKGFKVDDARTGGKTRLVFTEIPGHENAPKDWPDDNTVVRAKIIKNGDYKFSVIHDLTGNDPFNCELQNCSIHNVTAILPICEFDQDGRLRISVSELERAYTYQKPIKVNDVRNGKSIKIKIDPQSFRTAFNLLNAPDMVLTAKAQTDGSYSFKYSSPGWIDRKKGYYLFGTDFLDLKATVVESKSKSKSKVKFN